MLSVLLSFTAIASIMTGCQANTDENSASGNSSISEATDKPDSSSNSETTESESQSQDDNNKNTQSSTSESSDTSSNATSNASSNNSSNSNSSTETNKNPSNNSSSKAESSKNTASGGTLTIDKKKYSVGDTVIYTVSLTTPDIIENFEGTLEYDSSYLEVVSSALSGPAKTGGLINSKTQKGIIYFNGVSVIDGFDYTKQDKLFTVTYKVLKAGSTSPKLNWSVMTQKKVQNGTPYIENGKPVNGMKYTAVYS